jgi:hypothetical protein
MADFKIIDSQASITELDNIIQKTDDLAVAWKDRLLPSVKAVTSEMAKGTPKEYSEALKKAVEASKTLADTQKKLADAQSRLEQIEKNIIKTRQTGNTETEKARVKEIQLQQAREKAVDRFNALEKKEQQRIANAASLYSKLEQKLKSLQLEYRDLAAKKELNIRLSAEEEKRMLSLKTSIDKYDTTLKAVDASMGKYQRNVGNYERANNGLGMSLAQITREMPAFANSVSTGFMALSNNIPIFFDAIGQVKNLNKEFQAQGKPTVSVMKQLAGAFFSWQTLLSVGVTLLTIYGADIVKFGKNLIFGASSIKSANDLMKDSTNITKQMNEEYADSLSLYMRLRYQWLASAGDLKERNKFLRESKDEFSKLGVEINSISEAEDFLIKNTQNVVKALSLRARAAAYQDIAKEEQRKAIEGEEKTQKALEERQNARGKFWSEAWVRFKEKFGVTPTLDYLDNENNALRATEESIKIQAEVNKLLEKYAPIEKGKKTKEYKGSRLTGEQRDYLMDLETRRKNEITAQDKLLYDKKINEEEYWTEYKAIIIRYRDAVDAYLNDKNAKERKIDADTKARALQALKEANGKLFDLDKESLTKRQKLEEEYSSNRLSQIKQNETLNEVGVINEQIKAYNDLYDTTDEYYKNLIKSAEANKQLQSEINAIQLERQTKLADVAEKRDSLVSGLGEASIKDTNNQAEFLKTIQALTFEEQKRAILANKKLTDDQRSYMLSILEKDNTIKENNLEIERLKTLKNQLQVKIALAQLSGVANPDDLAKIAEYDKLIGGLQNQNTETERAKKQSEADKAFSDLQPLRNIISEGFQGLGLGEISDEFDTLFKSIVDKAKGASDNFKEIWKDATNLVGEYAKILVEQQTQRHIQELDKQLEYTKNATEQELGFIDKRLEYYSNMEDLTAEQIADRNALEDEARAYREQQEEREKLIAIQKAKAEQRASATKAIIGGLQGAAVSIAKSGLPEGLPYAIASTAMGALLAALIMSKNPVPQYFVGREGGRAEYALTQERGAEAIVDKKGNVKTWGNGKGAQLTWLDEGDSVLTASETLAMKRNIDPLPELDYNFYRSNAIKNIGAPIIVKSTDNSDAIAEKVGNRFDKIMNKYDKEHIFELNGQLYSQKGGQIPIRVGKAKQTKIEIKVNRNGRD